VESIIGEVEVWSRHARGTVRKGHNFGSDRWITIKLLLELPDTLIHGVDVESIIGEVEVWSRHARVMVRKSHNFYSDRWIAIKLLLVFPDALSMEWLQNP